MKTNPKVVRTNQSLNSLKLSPCIVTLLIKEMICIKPNWIGDLENITIENLSKRITLSRVSFVAENKPNWIGKTLYFILGDRKVGCSELVNHCFRVPNLLK